MIQPLHIFPQSTEDQDSSRHLHTDAQSSITTKDKEADRPPATSGWTDAHEARRARQQLIHPERDVLAQSR